MSNMNGKMNLLTVSVHGKTEVKELVNGMEVLESMLLEFRAYRRIVTCY